MPSTSAFHLDHHQGSAQTLDALHPLPLPTWFHQAEQDIVSLLHHLGQQQQQQPEQPAQPNTDQLAASSVLPSALTAVYAVSIDSHDHRSHNLSNRVSCHDLYHPGFAAFQQVYRLLSALDRFNTSLTEHFFYSRFGIHRSRLHQLLDLSSPRPRSSVAPPSDNRSLHPGNQLSYASAASGISTTAHDQDLRWGQGADIIHSQEDPLPEPPKAPLVQGACRRGIPPPSTTWATFDCSRPHYPQVVLPPPVSMPGLPAFPANQSPYPLAPAPSFSSSSAFGA
ncbi:hypothetical protein BCR44DRAFT_54547 [Catenaria anguillulae PL171]|uniref:Uncharacterized protein n=1 Tax=Catenaria anguillulae PL171 TaxID=765915 RepID=A0A1Y2HIR1_9FUNG|nr:hypothetical protein BCR44DRAFT_54547 [Catenaria anguillulae PL171]